MQKKLSSVVLGFMISIIMEAILVRLIWLRNAPKEFPQFVCQEFLFFENTPEFRQSLYIRYQPRSFEIHYYVCDYSAEAK
mmetsp:Transcript_4974/g.7684  ORF Transcript_4974/g.7684 Transcript_4974/m.7684 type:complete len:80 (-) Transcript_4974:211-450(-)